MRPLSNQSPSTFLPHGVAAPAGLAAPSATTDAQREHDERRERAKEEGACHGRDLTGGAGTPAMASFPARGEPVMWGE